MTPEQDFHPGGLVPGGPVQVRLTDPHERIVRLAEGRATAKEQRARLLELVANARVPDGGGQD